MKLVRFISTYKPDFYVVKERRGTTTLYPHTDQLPILLRALTLEFRSGLSTALAKADERAGGFVKFALNLAALQFCGAVNAARPDNLRLFPYLGRDLITRVALVQQVTEPSAKGSGHRFLFYTGAALPTEIYLSGKRVVFTDHAVQRFSERAADDKREDLTFLLITFFGCPMIAMPVNGGRALVVAHAGSIVALTYQESDTEFVITTCLTMDEIHSLEIEAPPQAFNWHYDKPFVKPQIRNWVPTLTARDWLKRWEDKKPIPPVESHNLESWPTLASRAFTLARAHKGRPGMKYLFLDHIPSPCAVLIPAGGEEPQYNELEMYKGAIPTLDWDARFAQCDARKPKPRKAPRKR
jgi:hypothetical protein